MYNSWPGHDLCSIVYASIGLHPVCWGLGAALLLIPDVTETKPSGHSDDILQTLAATAIA